MVDLSEFFETIKIANMVYVLFALDSSDEELKIGDIWKFILKETHGSIALKDQSLRNTVESLVNKGMVKAIKGKKGKRKINLYRLTPKGKKLVNALKKFLEELERQP